MFWIGPGRSWFDMGCGQGTLPDCVFPSLKEGIAMAELPTNANICEVNGAYYPVYLTWIPRVGDYIDLTSFIDMADKRDFSHQYKVVDIVHTIQDVTDKTTKPSKGSQWVDVYVKPARIPDYSAVKTKAISNDPPPRREYIAGEHPDDR